MNNHDMNRALGLGDTESPGVLPKLRDLAAEPYVFAMSFGLSALPSVPGVLFIRGGRQFGKNTWLQQQIAQTIREHGPGSAFFLNGDEVATERDLVEQIRGLLPLFASAAAVRRLFIDEVTAIPHWERGLKVLLDGGELRRVLVVTTGSKAADLRHGGERLPGRKGRLARTDYLFTPVRFSEFVRVCGGAIRREHWLPAHLLAGGSPVACSAIASQGHLPEYVIQMVRDWVYGDFAATGRSRSSLLAVLECLQRFAGTAVGQSKLAREAALANNTVAAGYIDLLKDLLCVAESVPWDAARRRPNRRRPSKYHVINLLAAMAWHPRAIRSVADMVALPPVEQGALWEWGVAQELWRRAAIAGDELPEELHHWQHPQHEIDFVTARGEWLEVKRGASSPMEFGWFVKACPGKRLTVISASRYETDVLRGITMEDFLNEATS